MMGERLGGSGAVSPSVEVDDEGGSAVVNDEAAARHAAAQTIGLSWRRYLDRRTFARMKKALYQAVSGHIHTHVLMMLYQSHDHTAMFEWVELGA